MLAEDGSWMAILREGQVGINLFELGFDLKLTSAELVVRFLNGAHESLWKCFFPAWKRFWHFWDGYILTLSIAYRQTWISSWLARLQWFFLSRITVLSYSFVRFRNKLGFLYLLKISFSFYADIQRSRPRQTLCITLFISVVFKMQMFEISL